MTMNREKYKSRGAFGRGPEYRSSKYHLYAQSLLFYFILNSVFTTPINLEFMLKISEAISSLRAFAF